MPYLDPRNQSQIWLDPDINGLFLMQAEFTSHEFSPHSHEELVIAVTERGGSEFRSRGIYETAEPGAVLVFNPGEPHSGQMGLSKLWRYRSFYLGASALNLLAEDLEISPQALPHFLTNKLEDISLCRRFLALHRDAEQSGSGFQKETELLSVLANLFVRHGAPELRLQRLGDERSVISKIVQYLSENFEDNISLNTMAQISGMSKFHLIRCFNKEIGISPHAFLTQVRMQHARKLLEHEMPPSEIAIAVGLYDQSALSRHFKRAYGVTPGQYADAMCTK